MRTLRILFGIVLYLGAVALVAAAVRRWIEGDGTIDELQMRMIAIGEIAGAIVLWIVAAFLMKSGVFTIGRVIVLVAVFAAGVTVAMNTIGVTSHSRAKRTMSDLADIASAVEAYNGDHGAYPIASSIDQLAPQLQPTYLHETPRTDAWGFPLRYEVKEQQFWIGSAGKHGKWEYSHFDEYTKGETQSLDDDLVLSGHECVRCMPQ